MSFIWDTKSDVVKRGDKLRDVSPLVSRTKKDDNGYTHYLFGKAAFNSPWYDIPADDFELFQNYVAGGSRAYPSDGNIPCDLVVLEARIILNKLVELASDPNSNYHKDAKDTLKDGKQVLVRGTLKLYLGKYTTRDWRRKRFTDDIDFWIFRVHMLEHVLVKTGWIRNHDTREWEKKVHWVNPFTGDHAEKTLIAANDLDQLLDFGAGSYLEGTSLKQVFQKKIKRGHDVDLSDVINVIMVNGGPHEEEWLNAWNAFEEAANTRNTRITSNLISLCRYLFTIADYLERVGQTLTKHNDLIFDKEKYPDERLQGIGKISIHWLDYLDSNGPEKTREMLHDFYHEQADLKPQQAKNLRVFAEKLLKLLNSKYQHLKIAFEIET